LTKHLQIIFLSLIAGVILLSGCKSSSKGSEDEGLIQYDVKAVDAASAMAALAPTSMTLKFKNDMLVAEMKTGMSAVGIKFVSDDKKKVFTQLVRILNQKYCCTANNKNLKKIFKKVPEYDVKKVEEYKTIAGIQCRKAEIFEKGTSKHLFDVYYTDQFKLNKPNWWNEFSEIDGLLMEYNMKRFNMELHFVAKKFDQVAIDVTEFNTKGDYTAISEDELESYFESIK
jgi:hypothetical protein